MKYTAPFLAITFISVFLVPTEGPPTLQFWWYLISTILYDTAYTIIGLVYSALLPEITESDAQRGSLSTFSSFFSLIGMIVGFLIPDLLKPENHGFTVFYMGIIGIAVIGAVCIIVTASYVKERPEFTEVDEPLGLWESLKFTFTHKSFLILASANFMSILMQSLILGSVFYLADYVLGVSGIIVLLFVIAGLIIGVLTVNIFAKKFGVVQTHQTLLIIAGVFLSLIVVVPDPLIYGCLFVGGIGLSGPLVLTNILFSQVADEDEIKSGVRREASFFGVNALITKPAQSLAAVIVVWILEWTEFKPRINGIAQNQPESALFGIKIFIGLIPGIALIIGALILFAYPLRGDYLEEINEKVLLMHDEKYAHWEQMGQ
jgi:GPH family glycoside/pentoside/hexuronide:cation symporter